MAKIKAVVTTAVEDEFLVPAQVSEVLRVSRQTLSYWRARNTGPLSIQVGSSVRYPRREFEAWLARQAELTARGESASPNKTSVPHNDVGSRNGAIPPPQEKARR
ncbi:helix-turn-helix domain-containing protein [Mycobacteroides abscessus subsp. abscessus]|nr:helix-turn-helix domain-containing protein [Mycobacteroides abscessus subsp. abscessus]